MMYVGEQMAIAVHSHLDGGMAELGLDVLRGFTLIN
jgi:hypothetical protein